MKVTRTKNSWSYGNPDMYVCWASYTYDGVDKKKLHIKLYSFEIIFNLSSS